MAALSSIDSSIAILIFCAYRGRSSLGLFLYLKMEKRNFWFKFEWDDWLGDDELAACTLETQGFWIRCIATMRRKNVSEFVGSIDQLRRKFGVLPEELTRCLLDLKNNNAADVRFGKDDVSIKSRRIERELKDKENNRLYVSRHRAKDECKDDVSRQSKSKSKSKKKEEEREEAASPPAPADQSEAISIYFQTFPEQRLNFYQQDLITDRVSDLNRWRAVLLEWKANGWVARNVNNILSRYDTFTTREKKYGKPEASNRKSELSTEDVLAAIGADSAAV